MGKHIRPNSKQGTAAVGAMTGKSNEPRPIRVFCRSLLLKGEIFHGVDRIRAIPKFANVKQCMPSPYRTNDNHSRINPDQGGSSPIKESLPSTRQPGGQVIAMAERVSDPPSSPLGGEGAGQTEVDQMVERAAKLWSIKQ